MAEQVEGRVWRAHKNDKSGSLDMDGCKLMGEKELRKQMQTFIEEDHFVNIVKTHESKSARYDLNS